METSESSMELQPLEPSRPSDSLKEEEILYEGSPSSIDVFCSCSPLMLCLWFFIALAVAGATMGIGLLSFIVIPYWISLTTKYKITNQRVFVVKGMLSREEQELELLRVKDISLRKQNLREQMVSLGTIRVISTDPSAPTLTLRMRNAEVWRDRLRDLVRLQKKEAGVQYREEL